jgi:hypothetical protein
VGVGGRSYLHQVDGGIALGIVIVVALSVSSALTLRLLLHSPVVINWVADDLLPDLRRRWHRPLEQPVGRPIQEIAASIRRLGTAYYGGPPGRSWAKTDALRRAYEQALAEGCQALEISTDLITIQPGTEHDAERLRVEHLLMAAGLILRNAA